MNNKSTKLLLPLLGISLLALSSCKPASNNSSKAPGGLPQSSINWEDDSINDLQYDEAGNVVFNNVELNMWSVCTSPDSEYQDQLVRDFNEAYKGQIKINVYHESRYSIYSALAATVTQDPDNAPDIFYGYGEKIASLQNNDIIVPMDYYLDLANIGFSREYFEPVLINNCYVGNRLFGLPVSVDSTMIFVRKDILVKNGLSIPTNYVELMATCDSLVEKAQAGELWVRGNDSQYISTGNVYEWRKYVPEVEGQYYPFPISSGDMWVNAYLSQTVALQNGGKLVDENGMPAYNSDEVAKGLQILRDWTTPTSTSQNKYALSKIDLNYDAGISEFHSGVACFYLDGAWSGYKDTAKIDTMFAAEGGSKENLSILNFGNLFALDNTQSYANKIFGDSHTATIVKTCKSRTERVAAAVFSNYLAENSGGVWTQAGHLPASLIVQQSEDLFLGNEYYEKYVQYYGTPSQYETFPQTIYYDEIYESYQIAIKQAMASTFLNKPIKDILQENYDDCVQRISDREDL